MNTSSNFPVIETGPEETKRPGLVRSYCELMRVPNVFTAISNIAGGFLVSMTFNAKPFARPVVSFVLLALTSACLYLAGMVLNDVFDARLDAEERPERPIPSGRISTTNAKKLGWSLFGFGLLFSWSVVLATDDWRPGVVGSALALAIILYDRWMKGTALGPATMGLCRGLNVLLGMSLAGDSLWTTDFANTAPLWFYVIGVFLYTLGLTQFAKFEAAGGCRKCLISGTTLLIAGMAMLAALPMVLPELQASLERWQLLWGVLIAMISWRCVKAIVAPHPKLIRSAVGNAITSFIFLDAGIVAGVCGSTVALLVLSLVLPTMILQRWYAST